MLLPVTVHGRVSDIWRSYFTQALLPLANAVPVFAPAWVEQVRVDSCFWARVRGGAEKNGSGNLSLMSCRSCFAWMGIPWSTAVHLHRDENSVFRPHLSVRLAEIICISDKESTRLLGRFSGRVASLRTGRCAGGVSPLVCRREGRLELWRIDLVSGGGLGRDDV